MSEWDNYDYYPDFPGLDAGQIIITEANLTHLEETLTHILHRAKYFGEYTFPKLEFTDMIEGLIAQTAAIRRTAQS